MTIMKDYYNAVYKVSILIIASVHTDSSLPLKMLESMIRLLHSHFS